MNKIKFVYASVNIWCLIACLIFEDLTDLSQKKKIADVNKGQVSLSKKINKL